MAYITKHLHTLLFILLVSFVVLPFVSESAGVLDSLIGEGKDCNYVKYGLYKPYSDINQNFPTFGKLLNSNGCIDVSSGVEDMFKYGFIVFLSLVTLIAVVQISYAGIQWMTQESSSAGKTSAKQRLTNAIVGLILALSGWLILYTVNPRIVEYTVSLKENALSRFIQQGINQAANVAPVSGEGECIQGTVCKSIDGQTGSIEEYSGAADAKALLNVAQDIDRRSQDGGLNISLYSSSGDSTTDSGTAAGRGNNDNLLVAGSVALSPDLVDSLKSQGMRPGQEILVNGTSVGYWDDTTGTKTDKGVPIVNTIDLYNQGGVYGDSNNTLRGIPAGGYQITLGSTIRPQTPNPSK